MKLSSFFVAQASASAVFRLFDEPKTFKDAEKACESRSATLAFFNDNDEYADFKKAAGNKDFVWTGISRGPGGHIWRRPDGQIADIIPWNPNEPNNAGNNEHCVERSLDNLNDIRCSAKIPFVCRWQKDAEFVVYNKWANFKDAENFCHAKGGTLPFFTSPFQWFDFSTLLKYKGASHAWLGVKRCGANSWMAVDNTPEQGSGFWPKMKSESENFSKILSESEKFF